MKRTADTLFVAIILCAMLLPATGLLAAKVRSERAGLAAYMEDNLSFRPELVTLHAKASQRLFSQTGSGQVLLGREGWLFFADTLPDYFRRNVMTEAELDKVTENIITLSESLADRGIGFTFLCAPNKNTVYPEYMPWYAVSPGGPGNLQRLQEALVKAGVDVLDAAAILRSAKSEGQLYLKTDTHWNARGALLVYRALMERLTAGQDGAAYDPYDMPFDEPAPVYGDLSVLYLPLSKITEQDALPAIERRYVSDGVIRSRADMLIRTRSDGNGLSVLVLRDSFGEALFPYLANNVGRLVFARGAQADETLLEREAVSHVVLQIAERNLPTLIGN